MALSRNLKKVLTSLAYVICVSESVMNFHIMGFGLCTVDIYSNLRSFSPAINIARTTIVGHKKSDILAGATVRGIENTHDADFS